MTPIVAVALLSLMTEIPENGTSSDDAGPEAQSNETADTDTDEPPDSAYSPHSSNTAVRLLAETAGAAVGAATVYALGYYLVALPAYCTPPTEDCEVLAWVDPLYVAVLGFGAGAWLGGKLAGSQSDWWPPFAGVLAGTAAAAALDLLAGLHYPTDWLVFYSLTFIGAIAGAELSHFAKLSPLAPPAAITPLLGPTYQGVAITWRM